MVHNNTSTATKANALRVLRWRILKHTFRLIVIFRKLFNESLPFIRVCMAFASISGIN